MKNRKIMTLLAAAACAALLTGCGQKTVTYATEDYISISVNGVNGEGRLDITDGSEDFYERINNDLYDGEATDEELMTIGLQIYDSVDYKVDGGKDELSNGDKVTVKMTADNERLKKYGVQFKENDYVYTVSGLEEPKVLDVWSGLEIRYEGIAPQGSAEAEYKGSDEFVKNNVRFSVQDGYGLSNGDEFTVKAEVSQSRLDEENYTVPETEKKFTAAGLPYYAGAEDINGQDMSGIDEQLLETAKETASGSTWSKAYRDGSKLYGMQIKNDGSVTVDWSVDGDYTIKTVKKLFYKNPDEDPFGSPYNSYTVFYELTFPCSNVKTGETYDLIIYAEAHANNIVISDGEIDMSEADIGGKYFGKDLLKNYLGLSLEQTIAEHEDNCFYTDWKKDEIK